jgi:hypothetical protein
MVGEMTSLALSLTGPRRKGAHDVCGGMTLQAQARAAVGHLATIPILHVNKTSPIATSPSSPNPEARQDGFLTGVNYDQNCLERRN